MTSSKRIDLHCHSIFSDGVSTPEAVAEALAASGVQYASLTDHDTISGLQEFMRTLQKLNIGFIPGVEITTFHYGQEIHLLGYGFETQNNVLNTLLDSLRQVKTVEIQGVSHSLRKASNSSSQKFGGKIELARAIKVIHQAGGKAFLAHPLQLTPELGQLESMIEGFKELGLDGIEAWYSPYQINQQERLAELAHRQGLLVTGGSDAHDANIITRSGNPPIWPTRDWVDFRNSLTSGKGPSSLVHEGTLNIEEQIPRGKTTHLYQHRRLVLSIILPVLFTIALFTSALWGLILPSFEQSLLDRKREMISELTNSAWSVLVSYESREQAGQLTLEEAQQQAISQISALRYGVDGKDYFWLQDFTPRIIMHPYRQDLIGKDVSDFQDPNGVRIFVEFANLVKKQKEGYVQYVWQWNDDPSRLEAKESFVKVFEPWGWIIGTGLYVEDVQQEIARIENGVVNISLVITGFLVLLLLFIAYQGILVESKRSEAELGQREATEKFRSLVEATTEGVLMVLGGRCRYANPTMLNLLDLTVTQLELMDMDDVLPLTDENLLAWEAIKNPSIENAFEGVLIDSTGKSINCAMTVNTIQAEGHSGFVFTAKPLADAIHPTQSDSRLAWKLGEAVQTLDLGVFRSKNNRQATITEINPFGANLIRSFLPPIVSQPGLENLFSKHSDFEGFLEEIRTTRSTVKRKAHLISPENVAVTLEIQAKLEYDEKENPVGINGTILDVSEFDITLSKQRAHIEMLNDRMAYLQKPVSRYEHRLLTCTLETPVRELIGRMNSYQSSAILITAPDGSVVGIVTDHDLRTRYLSKSNREEIKACEIMSAPVIRAREGALIYQALSKMEENGIGHLVLENDQGKVVSILEDKQLFHYRDYGFQVLKSEFSQSSSAGEIALAARRIPILISGLMESDVKSQRIMRFISSSTDDAINRLINLAIQELGEPPCKFCFIVVGSLGRQEPSLASDQDNAIIFENELPEPKRIQAEQYLGKLGIFVCEGLNRMGIPFCPGKIMANNPRWVLPLESWVGLFRHWINAAEPEELLDFSIFFDLRCVFGESRLMTKLLEVLKEDLNSNPIFYAHLAQNTLATVSTPVSTGIKHLLGTDVETRNSIDVKELLFPLISITRLYSLYQGMQETNTIDRIRLLSTINVIHSHTASDLIKSIDFLNALRLRAQITSILTNKIPTNIITTEYLTDDEKRQLEDISMLVNTMQKKVSMDFLGGTQV